jgi:hypothetical protein
MKTNTTFLKFREEDGTEKLVAIDDILCSGHPIDPESGEDLELIDNNVYRGDGTVIE